MKPIPFPKLWRYALVIVFLSVGTVFAHSTDTAPDPTQYVVQSGDSLSKIARKLDLSVEILLATNPQIENPNAIFVGQTLSLPNAAPVASQAAVPAAPTAAPIVVNPTAAPTAVAVAQPTPAVQPPAVAAPVGPLPQIGLLPVTTGLQNPTYVTHAGDNSERLFVVEQRGIIWIVEDGVINPVPFLNINQQVLGNTSEKGFLGLAFDPNYAQTGHVYGHYSNLNGDNVVARWTVSEDPNVLDSATEVIVMQVAQPFVNHNGGHLAFGPDGYLYLSLGDGGGGGDPLGHGQNPNTVLGAILRIDVAGQDTYAIPPSNPYANGGGAPEVWATGLRNPWRFSFDRATGNMFIADVGQNEFEEISLAPAGVGGLNFGWNVLEGNTCYRGSEGCNPADFVAPLLAYDHSLGCSVTGGYVYRGVASPQLNGVYLYGDYCTGTIWGLYEAAPGDWQSTTLVESGLFISSFGEDQAGEIYVVDYIGGGIYKVVTN